jgi:endogenous inhibitor of DNA gyrase (YacG/DUF329 family)
MANDSPRPQCYLDRNVLKCAICRTPLGWNKQRQVVCPTCDKEVDPNDRADGPIGTLEELVRHIEGRQLDVSFSDTTWRGVIHMGNGSRLVLGASTPESLVIALRDLYDATFIRNNER